MYESDFRIEVDRTTTSMWSESLDCFADANIYQTWAYGAVRWGEKNLSHLMLRRGDETVAMAQLVLAGPRKLGIGIAYLRWGPLWHMKGGKLEVAVLERMAAALHDEYVIKRRLFLRILPNAYVGTDRGKAFHAAFGRYKSEGFKPGESYRTLGLDLTPSLDVLRKGLDQKWRNRLNRAEKNGLAIRDNQGKAFASYIAMHEEMLARKRFAASSDIRGFERMQQRLPSHQRMNVLICEQEGVPVAGFVGTRMGDSAIYLFGATTEQGMKSQGAYFLQWRMIQWLKEQGVTHYDLGGINPETNPGVYHFKSGLSGKDVLYLTPFVSCNSVSSELFVKAANFAGSRVRGVIKRLRGKQ